MNSTEVGQMWVSRPFVAGPLCFVVMSSTIDAAELVGRLLDDLPLPPEGTAETEVFALRHEGDSERSLTWRLNCPHLEEQQLATLPSALAALITAINLEVLALENDRLHIHAAAAVLDGAAVVISAPRDTGKTTTLTHLLLRGLSYVSDEAVSIGASDDHVAGFPKPLSIKPGGRGQVANLEAHFVPGAAGSNSAEVLHIPAGALAVPLVDCADPCLIVILRRDRSFPEGLELPRMSEIHACDAVVALMGETMDAERFGPTAVLELARLAARCLCVEVLAGSPAATAELVEDLLRSGRPAARSVEALSRREATPDEVISVVIGDRSVIHNVATGQIMALDPMATQIWLQLGGWSTGTDIDLSGPVVAPFVGQLLEMGLLRSNR
jgi:hypothetical protein